MYGRSPHHDQNLLCASTGEATDLGHLAPQRSGTVPGMLFKRSIERIGELTLTMQEEAQVVEIEISKARATKTTQSQPKHRDGLGRESPPIRLLKAGRSDLNGPQGNRITGPETTWRPGYRLRVEHRITWDKMPTRDFPCSGSRTN